MLAQLRTGFISYVFVRKTQFSQVHVIVVWECWLLSLTSHTNLWIKTTIVLRLRGQYGWHVHFTCNGWSEKEGEKNTQFNQVQVIVVWQYRLLSLTSYTNQWCVAYNNVHKSKPAVATTSSLNNDMHSNYNNKKLVIKVIWLTQVTVTVTSNAAFCLRGREGLFLRSHRSIETWRWRTGVFVPADKHHRYQTSKSDDAHQLCQRSDNEHQCIKHQMSEKKHQLYQNLRINSNRGKWKHLIMLGTRVQPSFVKVKPETFAEQFE